MKDEVRLNLPAQIDSLQECFAFIRNAADAARLAPQETQRLELVMEELFVNVARYAYAPDQGDVELGYVVEEPGRLAVQLSDSGRAFDPLSSDPPDFSRGLAERPLGGMGIYLVKVIADSIRYDRADGRNRLSFTFRGEVRAKI